MCGFEQFYKVSTPAGEQCNVTWTVTPSSDSDYDLYVTWSDTCSSTGPYDCVSGEGTGVKDVCSNATLSGTSYARVYWYSGSGYYNISVSVRDCVPVSTTTTTTSTTTTSTTTTTLDTTPPSLYATPAPTEWQTSDVTITLYVSDSESGVDEAKYRWDNSDCWKGTSFNNGDTITLINEGEHTLYLCAKDRAGNEATWQHTYKLDKTAPDVSIGHEELPC